MKASLVHGSCRQALSHCESLDSFRSSRSGGNAISEDEVASQVRKACCYRLQVACTQKMLGYCIYKISAKVRTLRD